MKQLSSPFKFLDSYQKEDGDVFFGRNKEIGDLYNALSGVKHLLVYGPSGAGKTSLVECGLRNQFSDADWFALTIRRGQNLITSVYEHINDALEEKINLDRKSQLPKDNNITFGRAIENLFGERYQPIYLLFDQFEELLLLGSKEEKEDFFRRLNELIRYKVPCRVMLIMREEFIGHLSKFEHLCPSIFQHRFHLEKMGRSNVREVISKILRAPSYKIFFRVENIEELTNSILAKLPDKKQEIELTHVQVFLSELWDRSNENDTKSSIPILHKGLILKNDNLEGVLDSFLKSQLIELEHTYSKKNPLELLAAMISERHTKLQLSENELHEDLSAKGISFIQPFTNLLKDLEQRRIIRTVKASDKTQFEISHDLLAIVIGQNLTEEMKMREKADDIYDLYLERQGFFSDEDMDYIRPYRQYKPYPLKLQGRIKESKNHLKAEQERDLEEVQIRAQKEQKLRKEAEQNAKRAKTWTGIASVIALLAITVALFANSFYKQALNLTAITDKARLEAENRFHSFQLKEVSDKIKKDDPNLALLLLEQADKFEHNPIVTESIYALYHQNTFSEILNSPGHASSITSIAFSKDGSKVITGARDKTIRLWNLNNGEEIVQFSGHSSEILDLTFSPNDKEIISVSSDNTIRFWGIQCGCELNRMKGTTEGVIAADFSPNGELLLISSLNNTIYLKNVIDQVELQQFKKNTSKIKAIKFSLDEKLFVSGSEDNKIVLWDIITGLEVANIDETTANITSLSISPNNKIIGIGLDNNTTCLWDVGVNTNSRKFCLEGHSSQITTLKFSKNGDQIITGSSDNTTRLWNTETGEEIQSYRNHTSTITAIEISPDGKNYLTGSSDNTARLIDIKTGKEIQQFTGHPHKISAVDFSPNGKLCAYGSGNNTVSILNMETDQISLFIKGHTASVTSISFSPDGNQILTGSRDSTARLWDIKNGKEKQVFKGHTSFVYAVGFSPDGRQVITGSKDRTARLWDVQSGKEIQIFIGHDYFIDAVAFSQNNNFIFTGSRDHTIRLWNTNTCKEIRQFIGHTGSITSLDISEDNKFLITGSRDSTSRVWDIQTGKEVKLLKGHTDGITDVRVHPNGKTIFTASLDKTIRVWDLEKEHEINRLSGHSARVTSIALTNNNGWQLLSGSWDNSIRRWNLIDTKIKEIECDSFPIYCIKFSPNGKKIAVGSQNPIVSILEMKSGKEVQNLKEHNAPVRSLDFSQDGKLIVTGSDTTARVWDIETGKVIQKVTGHSGIISSVDFSKNETIFVTGSWDSDAKIWDLDGNVIHTLSNHTEEINAAIFSPDGKKIATGSSDKTVRIWNVKNGKEELQINLELGWIQSIDFSNDSKRILIGTADNTVVLFDIESNNEIKRFQENGFICSAKFSRNEKFIAIGTASRYVHLWEIESGNKIRSFGGHKGPIYGIDFSPSEETLLTSSLITEYENNSIYIWALPPTLDHFLKQKNIHDYILYLNPNLESHEELLDIWDLIFTEVKL